MTVDEMRNEIKRVCEKHSGDRFYCEHKCRLRNVENCYVCATDKEIKENYKLMFGKEKSEMKNEFDFNELKAGWAIKLPSGSFCVGMQTNENEITFFERFENGELSAVCTKEDIINNKCENENRISFYPIEVYGYSENYELFDPSTRPLFYKKEDMNQKNYKIGNLIIKPNYRSGYKTNKEDNNGFIIIVDTFEENVTICKSELDDVINALTEIRDFVKENE